MAHIPDEQIDRLKQEVSVQRLAEDGMAIKLLMLSMETVMLLISTTALRLAHAL